MRGLLGGLVSLTVFVVLSALFVLGIVLKVVLGVLFIPFIIGLVVYFRITDKPENCLIEQERNGMTSQEELLKIYQKVKKG